MLLFKNSIKHLFISNTSEPQLAQLRMRRREEISRIHSNRIHRCSRRYSSPIATIQIEFLFLLKLLSNKELKCAYLHGFLRRHCSSVKLPYKTMSCSARKDRIRTIDCKAENGRIIRFIPLENSVKMLFTQELTAYLPTK